MSEPVLDAHNLSKSFGALKATDDVSLDLRRGEIHALIGPNGAGKSTLIKLITGEHRADTGGVRFEGRPLDGLGPDARARAGLARTFQVSSLMPEMSVLQNVILARVAVGHRVFRFFRPVLRDPALRAPAEAALARVGLFHRARTRVAELSHGERRKLEIAVALALDAKAFLLDEPMAGMGPEGSKELTGFLDALRAEAPILLVEHDMDAVFALADRVSVLVYGRVIATGSVDEIRRDAEVARAYLGEDT